MMEYEILGEDANLEALGICYWPVTKDSGQCQYSHNFH